MMDTYDPATYWPARYKAQGKTYVAKGGKQESYDAQVAAITPYVRYLPSKGRVLDYGCGPQRFRPALEARGLAYEGVDLIPGLGTMDAHDIEPGSFDAAVAIFVLQHIVDEGEYRKAVQALFDAVRPGGTVLVVDAEPGPSEYAHMEPRGWERLPFRLWRLAWWGNHWIGVFSR